MKQDDPNLDELLKRLRVPERSPGYWEYLPKRILARIEAQSARQRQPRRLSFLAWGLGLATACLAIGLTVGAWWSNRNGETLHAAQLAESQKLFQEVAAMFPNRLQSIVVDRAGVRLELSDTENIPESTPLLLSVCKGRVCQRIITFSGQNVNIDGQSCEVLADGKGHILLVGPRFVWSSAEPTSRGPYRIHAEPLAAS